MDLWYAKKLIQTWLLQKKNIEVARIKLEHSVAISDFWEEL
jgi:hypothetical protein